MAIDRNHLMNFNIPEVRQSYGPRDVAQYALSIGMGPCVWSMANRE